MATDRRRAARKRTPGTPRQAEILAFVRNYQAKHGYSPTLQEIGDYLAISKVTVFEHLSALESRGLIQRGRHKARSLEVADDVRIPAAERPTVLPLLGRVAAGSPIEAIENPETIDLEAMFAARRGTFALEVRGDSMIDDNICEGDYVVVEPRNTARDGETVVALMESGEATLKRYYREKNRIRLQPANTKYSPIYTDKVEIQGVVVGVLRRV